MPSGTIGDRLSRVIGDLSTRYSTPAFEPHITLFSGLRAAQPELIEKCAGLSRLLNAFDIRLTTIESRNEYFRALFLRAELAGDLEAANAKAAELLQVNEARPFLPHLSLLYGDIPAEEKQKLIVELHPLTGLGFRADSLHLVSTEGEPPLWRRLRTYPLSIRPSA